MIIELEQADKEYIDHLNSSIEKGEYVPLLLDDKGRYSISFDVVDIGKANNFLLSIAMYPSEKRKQETIEKFGVVFTSINLSVADPKIEELKEILRSFLHELEDL